MLQLFIPTCVQAPKITEVAVRIVSCTATYINPEKQVPLVARVTTIAQQIDKSLMTYPHITFHKQHGITF
jgi:hypothetical protein